MKCLAHRHAPHIPFPGARSRARERHSSAYTFSCTVHRRMGAPALGVSKGHDALWQSPGTASLGHAYTGSGRLRFALPQMHAHLLWGKWAQSIPIAERIALRPLSFARMVLFGCLWHCLYLLTCHSPAKSSASSPSGFQCTICLHYKYPHYIHGLSRSHFWLFRISACPGAGSCTRVSGCAVHW